MAINLKQLDGIAQEMATQAERLANTIKTRRVTHTESGLRRLINHVCQINKNLKTGGQYVKQFEKMLFQCQAGPLEVTIQKDIVYINGVVSISALKEFFIVNEPPGFDALEIAEKGK